MFMSTCQSCGVKFAQANKYRETKTCSRECRYALSGKSNKQTQGAQYVDRECPHCGKSFDGKTKYCSRTCSNRARAGDIHPNRKAALERGHPRCTVCGKPTQHTQRTTCPQHRRGWRERELATCPCGQPAANLRSKYCSEEHRKKWGVRAPVKMVTKVCLGCGEEFTRPWYFPGKMKYCSNKCSHSQQKKVRDKFILSLNEHAVVFHSGWEIRFWAACLRFDIPVRSYDGPDILTTLGVYRPDFILPSQVIIDVKGWLRPESAQKLEEAQCQGIPVVLVDRSMLMAFEQTGDLTGVPCPLPSSL